jgi:tetratricopeptide (TPR) repeat protein
LEIEVLPDAKAKQSFEFEAVKSGAFFELASALHGDMEVDAALFDCYSSLKNLPNSRSIINHWTKDIRGTRSRRLLANAAEDDITETGAKPWRDNRTNLEKFENVTEQQRAIISALEQGNLMHARRFTAQLIEAQLKDSDPNFAVMSLCKLAQEAKERGFHGLQLEWVEEALKLNPNDGWANGQAGDAYLDVFRFKEARDHFDKAARFGQAPFAAGGRARLLRVTGDYEGAIQAFSDAIKEFGDTEKAELYWIGYGQTRRRLWRFSEAHSVYTQA